MNKEELIKKVVSRKPRVIKNKVECYALYWANLFGNKALTWGSYKEIISSDWKGKVCMRGRKNRIKRRKVRYNISLEKVPSMISQWEKQGVPEYHIGFNQSMPDKDLIIQGEVMIYDGEFYLHYTHIKKPMNQALKEQQLHASGLKARLLLKDYLSYSSYSDMIELLDTYPENVIEFSTYKVLVGNLKRRNTVLVSLIIIKPHTT